MLTRRETFKAAFLAGCADQGLDMNETLAAVKQAQAQMVEAINGPKAETLWDVAATKRAGFLDNAYHTTTDLLGTGARMGTGLALGLPPLLGGALGYGAAALTDVNDEDVEETKLKELIDEHKRLAQRARMTAQLHAAKSQNVRRGRPLI